MNENHVVKVKICGIQSLEMIQAIHTLPISYVGFVFAPSKRNVTAEQVRPWTQYLNEKRQKGYRVPLAVGVFMNPSKEELTEVVQASGIDVVQLHEKESPALCHYVKYELGKKVMKVVSIASTKDQHPSLESVATHCDPYRDVMDILLLDTYDPQYGGGSGKTFSWNAISNYKSWTEQAHIELFVAGGLHADNVSSLLTNHQLDGVDVSSGVETDHQKDIHKIQMFVERVNAHVSSS